MNQWPMNTNRKGIIRMKEKRHINIRAEQDSDNNMLITGVPVVFNQATEINDPMGSYNEVIQRNALDGVDLTDTRLLYNHDLSTVPLAKAPKTMQLELRDDGLHMRSEEHTSELQSRFDL